MEQYLKKHYDEEITNLLNNSDDLVHVSLAVNLAHIQQKQLALYDALLRDPHQQLPKWNTSLVEAQKSLIEGNMFLEPDFQIKHNCHVRFVNMPQTAAQAVRKVAFPNNDHVGQFLQIKGRVFRMSQANFLEFKREYVCNRCQHEFILEAQYEQSYVFDPPRCCPMASETGCKGFPQQKNGQPQPDYCRHFQEVRVQEIMSEKNVPTMLVITLENDLVDSCQPGDCVTVVGTMERRWAPLMPGKKTLATVSMRANSVSKDESKTAFGKDLPEHLVFTRAEWQNTVKDIGELAARDVLVQSICPEIYGLYPVKLALALALASCTERYMGGGTTIRGHSHLLLVGDPGLAKSRLLKCASEIAVRSVFTTGVGCSAAGLTAAAVKEDGEWQLEAGALVLADGGICCIDEFNLMREMDKGSLHEAMEQQRISMAKAGLVCKLSSRCVVLAATNPKNLFSMAEMEVKSSLGIGGPLLSRFDLVLTLCDSGDVEWDRPVSNHVLSFSVSEESREKFAQTPFGGHWDLERLQTHFQAIRDIHPKITDDANTILSAYYKRCRTDAAGSCARTTARLLDSLVRLSQAYARLMFREEVTALDALITIRLMDSSWGFGRVFCPIDLIRAPLPLGPDSVEIVEMLQQLQLTQLVQEIAIDQVDESKVDQYRKKLAAEAKQKESAPVCSWDSVSTQPLNRFEEQVLRELDNNKTDEPTVVETDHVQSQKRKTLEDGSDLYSKYSFTQHKKNTVKKIKGSEPVKSHSPKTSKKSTSKSTPETDPKLKENLGNDELDCILSSLRQNFLQELSKATQPEKPSDNPDGITPRTSQSNVSFPLISSGRSRASREESFNAMLDVSSLLDDDSDEDVNIASQSKDEQTASLASTETGLSVFDDSAIFKTNTVETTEMSSRFSKDHALLVNPIEPSSSVPTSKFTFKRPHREQLMATEPSPASTIRHTNESPIRTDENLRLSEQVPIEQSGSSVASKDQSQSRFQCSWPRRQAVSTQPVSEATVSRDESKATPAKTNPVQVSQLLDFLNEDDIFGQQENNNPSESSCQRKQLSKQTLNKMREFEFVRREDDTVRADTVEPKDDSAYESQSAGTSENKSGGSKVNKFVETGVFVTLGEQRDPDEDLAFLDAIDF
ncbi:DNA helicase MCM9-like [Topomyia yanbarensis]|uniref:DNA helicase MCM9-like n=1 Tax=Topomyia yanbarensis TaxID=2498891 RepID=UPI00273B1924|nr:DNA helicase MCM9-like [Topomyia yanbarensis]